MQTIQPKIYRLRWRFEFTNKAAKYGQWSKPAARTEDTAAYVNKEGLLFAVIEGECMQSNQIERIVECAGWDFVNFEWVQTFAPPRAMKGSVVVPMPRSNWLMGLSLVTREEVTEVYFDKSINVKPRRQSDKNFHLEGFGK